MLDAVARQEGLIYKPNMAKNHQNTRSLAGRIATGTTSIMNEGRFDFIIIGSTPVARLVAGLLVSSHGKSVFFLGESQASYRLPRGFDLSVAPVTRPESWQMIKASMPEALKLISRAAGRRAWSRVDPILFAETTSSKEALGHIRHMAQAFGFASERIRPSHTNLRRDSVVLRDAVMLHRPILEVGLDAWMAQQGVRRVQDGDTIVVGKDGGAELSMADGRQITIGQTVLADDDAIIAHLPKSQWPELLTRRICSTISTEPIKAIAAPVMLNLDTGMTLVQQSGRGVAAMGAGPIDDFSDALGALLAQGQYRQAGQSSYQTVQTLDFGPAVGRVQGIGADVLAGLGPYGAFLAPAIARWLSGAGDALENAWFGARLVDRDIAASSVADFGAGG